jgi:hypothetical protein
MSSLIKKKSIKDICLLFTASSNMWQYGNETQIHARAGICDSSHYDDTILWNSIQLLYCFISLV